MEWIISMKKIYAVAVLFACAFLTLFNSWTSWLCPVWILVGIAILVWGKETGPNNWSWSWTIKKDKLGVIKPTRDSDSDILFKKGSDLIRNKQFDEALEVFNEIIHSDKNNDTAWVARGVVLNYQQQYKFAELAFNQALLINPANQKAINNREMVKKHLSPTESGIPDVPKTLLHTQPQKPEPSTAVVRPKSTGNFKDIIIGVITIGVLVVIAIVIAAFVFGMTGDSNHKPGESFVISLPGANGGTTQANILMQGDYQSNYGEHNQGYSYYYTINIANVGDKGIELPVEQSAEDSSGISSYIDKSDEREWFLILHPGYEKNLTNKIYLLQSDKTPSGGGTFHLYIGDKKINFDIPKK